MLHQRQKEWKEEWKDDDEQRRDGEKRKKNEKGEEGEEWMGVGGEVRFVGHLLLL